MDYSATSSPPQKKKRLSYLDVAKGLLILFLLLHHTIDFTFSIKGLHITNNFLSYMKEIQRPVMLCFFMQAFFFITGYCSNFSLAFKIFFIKQVKTLLFPAIFLTVILFLIKKDISGLSNSLILYGGLYWFLVSMFVSKTIFWCFIRVFTKSKKILFIVLLLLSLGGTAFKQLNLTNYWWIQQTCDLTLYIFLGNVLKSNITNRKIFITSIILYVATISCCYLTNIGIPHVTAGFNTTLTTWPIHIILSCCGTITFVNICYLIKANTFLEFIGKNSLIFYLFHDNIVMKLLKTFKSILQQNDNLLSLSITLIIIVITIIVLSIISHILNKKYFSWIIGKF